MGLLRGRQPKPLEDRRDVLLDRADGEDESLGDARVRAALRSWIEEGTVTPLPAIA